MTVITLTTVGYREVRLLDTSGQLWTMVLLITGVGTLFYAAVSSVELVVEGTIRGYFGRRRMEAAISNLNGHQILCGYGRVGRQVAREFATDDVPFVIIEHDPETVETSPLLALPIGGATSAENFVTFVSRWPMCTGRGPAAAPMDAETVWARTP